MNSSAIRVSFQRLRSAINRGFVSQALASASDGPHQQPQRQTGVAVVDSLNHAIAKHPAITGWIWLYHSSIASSIAYGGLLLAGVPAPPELGPAFIIHGVTRRLRMPLAMGLAGLVARVQPALTSVPVTTMLMAPLRALNDAKGEPPPAEPGTIRAHWRSVKEWGTGGLVKLDRVLGGSDFLNRYGLAYILAGRVVGTCSLISLTAAMHYGVDMQGAMDGVALRLEGSGLKSIAWALGLASDTAVTAGAAAADAATTAVAAATDAAVSTSPVVVADSSFVPAPSASVSPDLTAGTAESSSSSSSSAPSTAAAVAASGGGKVAAAMGKATEWTSRWALGCLLVNFCYIPVLRYGVAGASMGIGDFLDRSPRWRAIRLAIDEGKDAEEMRLLDAEEKRRAVEEERRRFEAAVLAAHASVAASAAAAGTGHLFDASQCSSLIPGYNIHPTAGLQGLSAPSAASSAVNSLVSSDTVHTNAPAAAPAAAVAAVPPVPAVETASISSTGDGTVASASPINGVSSDTPTCSTGSSPTASDPSDPPKQHWISRFYKTGHHCC